MKTGMGKSGRNLAENSFFQYWIKGAYPLAQLLRDLDKGTGIYCNGPGALTFALNLAAVTFDRGAKILLVSEPGLRSVLRAVLNEKRGANSRMRTSEATTRQNWLVKASHQLFSQQTSSDIAGLYLATTRRPEAQLLDRQLAFGDLEFSAEAYLDYREQIRLTQKLYLRIGYLPPAFQELNAGIFRHQELDDAQDFIRTKLNDFIRSSEILGAQMAATSNDFLRSRRSTLAKQERDLRVLLEKWEAALTEWRDNEKSGHGGRKQKKKLVEEILDAHRKTHRFFSEQYPFGFEWPSANKLTTTISEATCQRFANTLKEWSEGQRQQLREEQIALSAATDPARRDNWENYSNRLTELLESINNSGLLQRPISGSANTVSRQQKVVEQLLEKFRVLQQLLPELPAFFRWQRHWFSLPAELRRIVSPLLVFPDQDWPDAFAAWYFENGLIEKGEGPAFFGFYSPAIASNDGGTAHVVSSRNEIVIAAPKDLPEDSFDLVINFTEEELDLASPAKTLLLCQPKNNDSTAVHYLSGYGSYLPGRAFVQQWTSSKFPDWSAHAYPTSLVEAQELQRNFFGQAAEELGSSMEEAAYVLFVQSAPGDKPTLWVAKDVLRQQFHAVQLILTGVAAAKPELASILPRIWATTTRFSVVASATPDELTNALLSDGFSARFAIAATLRAIESIEDQDATGWLAIATECRKRLGAPVYPSSPLIRELVPRLVPKLPGAHLSAHVGWRDLFLPLVIQLTDGKKWVVLPDDLVPGADTIGVETDRRRELEAAGYKLTYVLTEDVLTNVEAALDGLIERVFRLN